MSLTPTANFCISNYSELDKAKRVKKYNSRRDLNKELRLLLFITPISGSSGLYHSIIVVGWGSGGVSLKKYMTEKKDRITTAEINN